MKNKIRCLRKWIESITTRQAGKPIPHNRPRTVDPRHNISNTSTLKVSTPSQVGSIAIAGNPNCGKSVLFNALTGSKQKIGNWSGVTVEKKTGYCTINQQRYAAVDLPGTYSLSIVAENSAMDEYIACDYLLSHRPDRVINVVDASNLERQLYLTAQLLEMQLPIIVVLNMMDIAQRRGLVIDCDQLSLVLGCPVIPMVAHRGKGLTALYQALAQPPHNTSMPHYTWRPLLQKTWESLQQRLAHREDNYPASWHALRLLEEDPFAKNGLSDGEQAYAKLQYNTLKMQLGEQPDLLIADARYRWVQTVVKQSCTHQKRPTSFTTKIDRLVLNRWLGIPIFLLMMYALFLFAINIGGAFQDFFDIGSTALFIHGTSSILQTLQCPPWLVALAANGLGKGINTVVTFIPVIGAMFLFLSLLEDSGYMARAAFVIDRLMAKIGLPGKAFVPLIVGFGCNVPTIMGTRTLAAPRDRILTSMMAPFMSCGARLTVYVLFVAAFFPHGGPLIIFSLYLIGIVMAILTGLLLGKTTLKGNSTPMILELPNYHFPHWRTLLLNTWQRLKLFLVKAGRFIIPICLLIGFLNSVSLQGTRLSGEANSESILSQIGRTVTPLFYPLGLQKENWPATVGLTTGLLAKEVVVGTLNTLYSQAGHLSEEVEEQTSIPEQLKAAALSIPNNFLALSEHLFNPLANKMETPAVNSGVYGVMAQNFDGKIGAFAYLLFILLYFPCVSTMAVMRREIGRYWSIFSVLWSTGIAYGVATLFYQGATFTEHPKQSLLYFLIIGLLFLGLILRLRGKIEKAGKTQSSACVIPSSTPKETSSGDCHG